MTMIHLRKVEAMLISSWTATITAIIIVNLPICMSEPNKQSILRCEVTGKNLQVQVGSVDEVAFTVVGTDSTGKKTEVLTAGLQNGTCSSHPQNPKSQKLESCTINGDRLLFDISDEDYEAYAVKQIGDGSHPYPCVDVSPPDVQKEVQSQTDSGSSPLVTGLAVFNGVAVSLAGFIMFHLYKRSKKAKKEQPQDNQSQGGEQTPMDIEQQEIKAQQNYKLQELLWKERESSSLKDNVILLKDDVILLQGDVIKASKQLASDKETIKDLNVNLKATEKDLAAEKENSRLKDEVMDGMRTTERLRRELEEMEETIKNKGEEIQKLEETIKKTGEEVQKLEDCLSKTQDELCQLRHDYEELKFELNAERGNSAEQKKNIAELRKQLAVKEGEVIQQDLASPGNPIHDLGPVLPNPAAGRGTARPRLLVTLQRKKSST